MGLELPERSRWAERALQGLVYWIGHRRAMYEGYPLSEGALVAETCNLIQSALHHDKALLCEQTYRKIFPPDAVRTFIEDNWRTDLVIADGQIKDHEEDDVSGFIDYLIEVKRLAAGWADIQRDMKRLHEAIRLSRPEARGLLFVVSESKRPDRFVTAEGASKKGPTQFEGGGWYVVRRTCKAAAKFGSTEDAHYACLIEVFHEKPKPYQLPGGDKPRPGEKPFSG